MLVGLYLYNFKTAKSSSVIAHLTVCFYTSPLPALCPMPNKSCPFCGIASQAKRPRIISQNSHNFFMAMAFLYLIFTMQCYNA